jgi:hypothetical protein
MVSPHIHLPHMAASLSLAFCSHKARAGMREVPVLGAGEVMLLLRLLHGGGMMGWRGGLAVLHSCVG